MLSWLPFIDGSLFPASFDFGGHIAVKMMVRASLLQDLSIAQAYCFVTVEHYLFCSSIVQLFFISIYFRVFEKPLLSYCVVVWGLLVLLNCIIPFGDHTICITTCTTKYYAVSVGK